VCRTTIRASKVYTLIWKIASGLRPEEETQMNRQEFEERIADLNEHSGKTVTCDVVEIRGNSGLVDLKGYVYVDGVHMHTRDLEPGDD
jgi:hypothetical protein